MLNNFLKSILKIKIFPIILSIFSILGIFYIYSWVSLFQAYESIKHGEIENIKYSVDWEHIRKKTLPIQLVSDELPEFGSGMAQEAESNMLTPEHCNDILSSLTQSDSYIYPHDMRILSYDLVELHLKQKTSLISIIMHFEKWHWRIREVNQNT